MIQKPYGVKSKISSAVPQSAVLRLYEPVELWYCGSMALSA